MNNCQGIVIEGAGQAYRLCRRRGNNEIIDGFNFCQVHRRIYAQSSAVLGARPPDRCHVISREGNYCPNNCFPGDFRCQRHLPPDLGGPEEQVIMPGGVGMDEFAAALANPRIRVMGFEDWGIPAPIPGQRVFVVEQRFAEDPQNVHRKEVSEQTNKATEFLMKVPLPDQRRDELWKVTVAVFLGFVGTNMKLFVSVIADIERWVNTDSCRKANDHLYRELLYRLIMYIQKSEHREELLKRLWEECRESVGMCCEGHLSRLCNVLVGYVEGIDPPVSVGELLQQKMAAIASLDISVEEKVGKAWFVFEELAIPMDQREAWIGAF